MRFKRTALAFFPFFLLSFLFPGFQQVQAQSKVRVMEGGRPGATVLAFSADGKVLAGSAPYRAEPFVTVWNVKSGQVRRHFRVQPLNGSIWALALSPRLDILAVGSGDQFTGRVQLWNWKTGTLIKTLSEGNNNSGAIVGLRPVTALAFSARGDRIAVGCTLEGEVRSSGSVTVFDVHQSRKLYEVTESPRGIKSLSFSTGRRQLIVVGYDIRFYSASSGYIVKSIQLGRKGVVVPIQVFPARSHLLAAAWRDQKLQLWDLNIGRATRTVWVTGVPMDSRNFLFSTDARHIAIGGNEAVKVVTLKN